MTLPIHNLPMPPVATVPPAPELHEPVAPGDVLQDAALTMLLGAATAAALHMPSTHAQAADDARRQLMTEQQRSGEASTTHAGSAALATASRDGGFGNQRGNR